jgi:hypothetical protein
MSLMYKPLDQVTEADLQQLISTPVYESRFLDYKEQLPSDSLSDKKEIINRRLRYAAFITEDK